MFHTTPANAGSEGDQIPWSKTPVPKYRAITMTAVAVPTHLIRGSDIGTKELSAIVCSITVAFQWLLSARGSGLLVVNTGRP